MKGIPILDFRFQILDFKFLIEVNDELAQIMSNQFFNLKSVIKNPKSKCL